MSEKYKWGIYNGLSGTYDHTDKSYNVNVRNSYLLNKTLKMFNYENLPDTIPQDELEKLIQLNGYACIIEVDSELYAVVGGLGGERGVYGEPTEIVVSNPSLKINKTYKIGSECIIIKNDYLGLGLRPLFNQYSTMMNENDITMILANVNSRVDNLISVSDDVTGESAKKYLKDIYEGNLGYIFENKLFDSLKSNPTSNSRTSKMTDLIEYQQYLKSNLLNEIGLQSNHNMKKERMITDEVNADSDSIYTLVDTMLDVRKKGLEQVNELFGSELNVEFGGSWKHRNEIQDEFIDEPIDEIEETEESEEPIDESEEIEETEEPIDESEETRISLDDLLKSIDEFHELERDRQAKDE